MKIWFPETQNDQDRPLIFVQKGEKTMYKLIPESCEEFQSSALKIRINYFLAFRIGFFFVNTYED